MEHILHSVLYSITGILAGALAGLFGVGGGVIVVPALALIFTLSKFPANIIMHMAVGTSLAAMVTTAISSVISHHRRKNVFWPFFFQLLPGIILGTILGTILVDKLPTDILKTIFGIFMLYVAFRMTRSATVVHERKPPGWIGSSFIGCIIGTCSGLLGIGGGAISIPLFTHYNMSLARASGTAAAVTLPIAITGAISFIIISSHITTDIPHATGYIYWPAVIWIGIFSVIGVPIGAKLAQILPVLVLRRIFAILLVIIAVSLIR